jgi:hypothetical protein
MREFRKPDLNAPRFRKKSHRIESDEFLNEFKKKYPAYEDLDISTAKKIIKYANNKLWQAVLDNRSGVELPESLGFIFIGTCTPTERFKNIDFGKSIKYGKTITNRNWDSDGKIAKIIYTNYPVKYRVKDRQIWNFVPSRIFKRTVAKVYPLNWTKYIQLDPTQKISKMFNASRVREYLDKKDESKLSDYNEFDI